MNLTEPGVGRRTKGTDCKTRRESLERQTFPKLERLLLDRIPQQAILLTPEGAVVDANRSALTALNIEREQATGRRLDHLFQDLLHGNSLDNASDAKNAMAVRNLKEALGRAAAGETAHCAIRMRSPHAGGELLTIELVIRPVRGDEDDVAFLLVEGLDAGPDAQVQIAGHPEHRLQASERECRRLQDLIAQSPAGIGCVTGPDHYWTYVNDAYVRLSGRSSAADFLGKTVRESMPEMEPQGFPERLDQVYATGEAFVGRELKARVNRSASGQPDEGYFDFEYRPMRDCHGNVEGIFIFAVEVTAKVMARKLAEESSERLRLAQAAAQIGSWEWDPIQGRSQLSPELHRILGTSPDDPERVEKWFSYLDPAERENVKLLMDEGYRQGRMDFEYTYIHPQAGERRLFCQGLRRPGESRMFGIVQDITVRKAAERDAQRLAAIVESSGDAIVSKDLKGIVTSWNSGAERIFGYTAAEMIGQPITRIIPPELHSEETKILSTVARGDRIQHFETVRVKKNGELVEISLTVSPVRNENGTIIGAAKIARDITQRKKVEQALRTTERLASVGRLAATVAHEINNPLEAVTNLIYLARHTESREQAGTYLGMVEEELERISHLTKQTLGFYRETKGATVVHIGELVNSLLTIFAPRMRNRDIRLLTEIEDVEINAIPGEIRQVVANLVSNSIDSLDTGGIIHVRVSSATQWRGPRRPGVRLTVADTGSGIPRSIRKQLFEPFFTTKKDVGTGLGLWICKSIVENHRGAIHVHSSSTPGSSGTVFSVFLPLSAEEGILPTELRQKAV